MGEISTAEVLRLRATSAVSRDPSVRRSAQDDESVEGLKNIYLVVQKTPKVEKVTGSQDDESVEGLKNIYLVVQKTPKDRKSHRLSG
jgi:hypothetical protein